VVAWLQTLRRSGVQLSGRKSIGFPVVDAAVVVKVEAIELQ